MNTSDNKKSKLSLLINQVPGIIKELFLPVAIIIAFLLITRSITFGKPEKEWMALLNQMGVFVTLATGAFAFSTWLNVQRLRSATPPPPGKAGDDVAILVIDIGNNNILGNVCMSCESNDNLRGLLSGTDFLDKNSILSINSRIKPYGYQVDVPTGTRIISVTGEYAIDNDEIAQKVYRTFSWIDRALHKNGISVLHVFYRGPVVVPFFLGELFSNSFATYVYKYVPGSDENNSTEPKSSGTEESMENKSDSGSYCNCGIMNHIKYVDRK